MEELIIDKMIEENWDNVARIYNEGIATKNTTFEKQASDWSSWNNAHREDCRLIARISAKVVGWDFHYS